MIADADSIQSVIFPSPDGPTEDARNIWGRVFPGDEPDSFQKATNSPILASAASAERNGLTIAINAQVGRIHLIVSAETSSFSISGLTNPPRISNIAESSAFLIEIQSRIAERYRILRASFILDLAKSVSDGTENVALIDEIGLTEIPPLATDLSIQVNVRKVIQLGTEVVLNRLCHWQGGQVGFAIAGPMGPTGPIHMSSFVGLKIDVNTAPEFSISDFSLPDILLELKNEALIIANSGMSALK